MAEIGVDLSDHLSRQLTADILRDAELIIGMTRKHVVGVATTDHDAWPRTFTLVELVTRAGQMEARRLDESVSSWVQRAHQGRTTSGVLTLPASDDIADPVGQPLGEYRRTRDRLDDLTGQLARLLAAGGSSHGAEEPSASGNPFAWTGWE